MRQFLFTGAILSLLLCSTGQTNASTVYSYNFADYYGQSLSSLPGVNFSLIGGPGPGGVPYVGSFGYQAIGNSPTGDYPTSNILDFSFTSPASDVSFIYDNFGYNGSYYQAFDSMGNLLDEGFVGSTNYGTVTVNASGISDLQLNNDTGGGYSWEFGVFSLNFTANATAVPEPATATMLVVGVATMAGCGWRRRRLAAV